MNLSFQLARVSDSELHEKTVATATKEKETTLALLYHLHEVERRRLFAKRGYVSLWEYTVQALGYSESQTYERVSAMRLMFRAKPVREAMEKGTVGLTQAAMVERHLRAEEKDRKAPVSREDVRMIVRQVEGKSKRETERVLLSQRPKPAVPERIKPVTAQTSEVRMMIDEETRQQIERFRQLHGPLSFQDVFSRSLRFYLEKKDPMQKKELRKQKSPKGPKAQSPKSREEKRKALESKEIPTLPVRAKESAAPVKGKQPTLPVRVKERDEAGGAKERSEVVNRNRAWSRARYIPAAIRQAVLGKSKGQCEYVDSETKRRCQSRYRLQIDHKKPFAEGGSSNAENLQMLCAVHNQHRGKEMMKRHRANGILNPTAVYRSKTMKRPTQPTAQLHLDS